MRAFFCAALTAVVTISAHAQTSVYVGPQIGILGFGASVEVDVGPVSFSGEASFLPLTSVAYEQSGTEFEMDTNTFSGLVMVNFAPTPTRFYIGAGVLIGGITADGSARNLRGLIEVGDGEYPATEIGEFNVAFEYDGIAPAAMIGLRGAGFNVGLGVALTGKPLYTMEVAGSIRNDAQFMIDLETETNNVQEHLDKIPLMPLLRIGWQLGVSG